MIISPEIIPLVSLDHADSGGKAMGLKRLKDAGFNVPDAFVLLHPQKEDIDEDLINECLSALGPGLKAVRSSAVSEDGLHASFAGQFESYLDLDGTDEIFQAVCNCIDAANHLRVQAYAGNIAQYADLRISVLIQNMIDAKVSGVLFTANPVNHRRDQIMINAVEGKGEILVSGMKDAHHYEIFRSGSNIKKQIEKNGSLLSEKEIETLISDAQKAETLQGGPVDMEWAIDTNGELFWLQLRPVTTLQEEHYNELDTIQGRSDNIWTLGNIGEMMPGVATPLTASVSAESIDYGMTRLAHSIGAFNIKNRKGPQYIQMFYNRLFINMSNMMDYPKNIWLNTPEDVQFVLSGKVFPQLTAQPEGLAIRRVYNFFRQVVHTMKAGHHLRKLYRLDQNFSVSTAGTAKEIHQRLEKARDVMGLGFTYHLSTSAQSGSLYSAFMRILCGKNRRPEAGDHHIATMLLLNIPGVESADAIKSLEHFAGMIIERPECAKRFAELEAEQALEYLKNEAPTDIKESYAFFNKRHGHRCVREAELREKPWAEDPLPIISILQKRVLAGNFKANPNENSPSPKELLQHVSPLTRRILLSLIPTARKAVARRETSKALSIHMLNQIRSAYRHLAKMLVDEGSLADEDQIFFLTHEEIGQLIKAPSDNWKKRADNRRQLFPDTDKMNFEEVCFGIPEPLQQDDLPELTDGQLRGTPVSSGVTEGYARIVNNLEEAGQLQKGEIMIASFTDIGWTPYFSIISALVTEIGSPLSHGAVVAREYGIPAVVGAKGAKRLFQNGDLIRVNGKEGIVEKIVGAK